MNFLKVLTVALFLLATLFLPGVARCGEGDYDRGVAYLRAGKVDEAIRLLEPLALSRRDDPYLAYHLGVAFTKAGRLDDAYSAYARLSDLSGRKAEDEFRLSVAFTNLGVAYYRDKAFDKARSCLSRSLALDPKDGDCKYYLGLIGMEKGEFDAAIADLNSALALKSGDPKDKAAIQNAIGTAYYRQEKNDRAIEEFTKTLQTDPENIEALYRLGALNYKEGGYSAARPFYERISSRGSLDEVTKKALATAYFNMGVDFQDRDRPGLAADMFGKAEAIRPDDPDIRFYRGYNLMAVERYEDAADELKKALELKPDMPKAKAQLEVAGRFASEKYLSSATGFMGKGDFYSALPLCEKASSFDPACAEVVKGLKEARAGVEADTAARAAKARGLLASGDFVGAVRESRELKRLNPASKASAGLEREVSAKVASVVADYSAKAREAEGRGALGKAAGYYTMLVDVNPDDKASAESARRLKARIDDTRQKAKKALEDGSLASARDSYVTLLKYTPEDEDAKKGMREAEDKIAKEVARQLAKARDAVDSGDIKAASQCVARALELSPGYDEAVALRAKIASRVRETAQRYAREGESYLADGKKEKAAESFRAALAVDPGNDMAQSGLDKVRPSTSASVATVAPGAPDDSVRKLYLKGVEYYTKGMLADAVATWKEVLKLDPDNDKARSSIAKAEQKLRATP